MTSDRVDAMTADAGPRGRQDAVRRSTDGRPGRRAFRGANGSAESAGGNVNGSGSGSASGYSLIETLIVLAIVAIIAAIATPPMVRLVTTARVSANANELLTTFEYARSEALARNTMVIVCRAADARAASPVCSAALQGGIPGDDWATGWIVYAKAQGDTTVSPYNPVTDALLRRFEAEGVRPTGDRALIVSNPAPGTIAFSSSGMRFAAAAQVPVYTIDHRNPLVSMPTSYARCVTLSVVGRPRSGALMPDGSCSV